MCAKRHAHTKELTKVNIFSVCPKRKEEKNSFPPPNPSMSLLLVNWK